MLINSPKAFGELQLLLVNFFGRNISFAKIGLQRVFFLTEFFLSKKTTFEGLFLAEYFPRKNTTFEGVFFLTCHIQIKMYQDILTSLAPQFRNHSRIPLEIRSHHLPPSPHIFLSLSLPLQLAFPWGCPLPFQFYFSLTPPFYSWKSTEKACQSPSPRSISGSGGNLVFLSSEPTSIYYIYQEKNVKDKNSNFNYLHLNSFFELQMQ